MVKRIDQSQPEDQPKRIGDMPSYIPARTPGDLMLEYRYIQSVIYDYKPQPPINNPDLSQWIKRLVDDATAVAKLNPNSPRHDLLVSLIGPFSKAANAYINNPNGATLDIFNKTFSNLQNEVNNWTIDIPQSPPYPDLVPKDTKEPAVKTKAFGEKPIEKFTSAQTPDELLGEYTEMKQEMQNYSPISAHPHLNKLVKQLVYDAHSVAEKYPHSGRLDQIQDLIETFHDASKDLQSHPQDRAKQDVFEKTFSNLYNEINNWADDKHNPPPHPDLMP